MTVRDLTQQNFDQTIQNHEVVVVDFWAKWCGPCLAFAPVMETLSEKLTDVVFAKVNIEEESQLAQDFNIRSIPMLMIFRREFAVFAESGVQTAMGLEALVLQAKQVDIKMLRQQVRDQQQP